MLFKQKGSPYWYAVIYTEAGKEKKWFSTKCKSRKDAKVIEKELKVLYEKKRQEKHLNRILGKKQVEPTTILVSNIVKKYEEFKKMNPTNLKILIKFLSWLEKKHYAIRTINDIDKHIALEYMGLEYKDSAPKTYNNVKSALNSIWKVLAIYDIKNPWDIIPNKSGDSKPYRAFTDIEVRKILEYTKSGFWYNMVLISYYTGLRLKDVVFLKWDSVHKDHLELIPEKTKRFKRAVYVHLHPVLIDLLKSISHNSDYVLGIDGKDHPKYNSGHFNLQFPLILDKCNICDNSQGVASFHSIRSTMITRCEEKGIDRNVVMSMVGHTNIAQTARYSQDLESGKIISVLPDLLK